MLKEKFSTIFNLNKPAAETVDGWADWEAKAKAEKPFVYFIRESLPLIIKSHTVWPLDRLYWKVMHRFHPKYRYHVVKPKTLTPNYYDPLTLILHTNMEILREFVEHQENHGYVCWDCDEEHNVAWKEMVAIRDWWVYDFPLADTMTVDGKPLPEYPEIPEEWGFMGILSDRRREDPISIEYSRVNRIHFDNESDWVKKENEMLTRLIKIRTYMWD